MMFQGGALLDSLSVYENLALPLRERRGTREAAIADAAHEGLEAVGLEGIDDLLPGALSGGMVKRVALARALIGHPQLLLCDEPFSGLDPLSTKLIEALLVRVNRELGVTMVVVSHHVPSTLRMADEIVLLLPRRVVRGTPAELLAGDDREVHRFLDETVDDTSDVLAHAAEYESERAVGGGAP